MPIVIGRATIPPDRPAFSERLFFPVYSFVGLCFCHVIVNAPGRGDRAARVHEIGYQALSFHLR